MPLSTFVSIDTAPVQPLVVNHQSQFPSVTISYNLKAGASLGDSVAAIQQVHGRAGRAGDGERGVPGHGAGVPVLAESQPYLIAAALIAVYIILGILYESYILPLTILSTLPSAGVGALLMLLAFGYDLTVIAIVGIILLIGIVKKNGIMMVDFAINAERKEGKAPQDAIREACLLRFRPILMTTMAALLCGLPLMLGQRRRVGAAQAAGLRDGGRAGAQPGADAVHDAGDLPVPGPAAALAGAGTGQAGHAAAGERHGRGQGGGKREARLTAGFAAGPAQAVRSTPTPRAAWAAARRATGTR